MRLEKYVGVEQLVITIWAYSIIEGHTLSGGDRIFIELAKRWAQKIERITILTSKEGLIMCSRYGLNEISNIHIIVLPSLKFGKFSFGLSNIIIPYLLRSISSICSAVRYAAKMRNGNRHFVFSSSPFWPDVLGAFVMKKALKGSKWIAGFYLFAPNPFRGGYGGLYKKKFEVQRLVKDWTRAWALYVNNCPVFRLVKGQANIVFVTNEIDRNRFICKKLSLEQVIAVKGGVDLKIANWVSEPKSKEYDAVFIGRLHPQKGVLELVDIWQLVCEEKKGAKLLVIGNGALEGSMKRRVKKLKLEKSVVFMGFQDGVEKVKLFKKSRIVLHPALYDSGGMAACEAMACGLPGVSFDLPALRSYYPKGMLKTSCFDIKDFAKNVLSLLHDKDLYNNISKDALCYAKEWSWDAKAEDLLNTFMLALKRGVSS